MFTHLKRRQAGANLSHPFNRGIILKASARFLSKESGTDFKSKPRTLDPVAAENGARQTSQKKLVWTRASFLDLQHVYEKVNELIKTNNPFFRFSIDASAAFFAF